MEKKTSQQRPIITVTHHIRNPVYVLKSYLEALQSEEAGVLNEKQREYLSACLRNTEKVSKTIEKMVSVIEAEEGLGELKQERVLMGELIKEVLKKNKDLFTTTNTNAFLTEEEKDLAVSADREKVQKVLTILLFNAVKYKRPGEAEVDVVIKKHEEGVLCSVADTGVGFGEAETEHIFKKFYRGSSAMKTDPGGIGVDLYVLKKMVEAMGGRVWAETRNERNGAVFSFILPYYN